MKWTILWAFLVLTPAFAANVEIEIQAVDVDSQTLKSFMHDAHEAFESEDPTHQGVRGFLSKWAQGFNIKQMGINAYRWYQIQKDSSQFKEHALNMAFMLSMSHTLEVASGPITVAASRFAEMPVWVSWAAGTAGTVISIPGLDPLCIGLIAIYPLKPVRNTVQFMRVYTVKILGGAVRMLGFGYLMNRLLTDEMGLERLFRKLNSEGKASLTLDVDALKFDFKSARIELERNLDDDIQLKKVIFSAESLNAPNARAELSRQLKGFGWNIRDAVLRSFDLTKKGRSDLLKHQVHVESVVTRDSGEMEISFRPVAVSLQRHKIFRCSDAAKSLAE